ncbi:hypothetical protein RIF29_41047 [Crotalaria pallida]|uniref:Patellin-4 n=1 Tax=Crotalaria pallida TaxID=3830 RepID=A0AAN9EAJ3_CROPI
MFKTLRIKRSINQLCYRLWGLLFPHFSLFFSSFQILYITQPLLQLTTLLNLTTTLQTSNTHPHPLIFLCSFFCTIPSLLKLKSVNMTAEVVAEVKAQEGTQTTAEVVVAAAAQVEEPQKVVAQEDKAVVVEGEDEKEPSPKDDESKPKTVEKSSSYKEESNFLSDLKEFEKKALNELKTKLEEAILGNNLFKKEEPKKKETSKAAAGEEKKEESAKESDEKTEKVDEEKKKESEEEKKEEEGSKESDEKNEKEVEEKKVEEVEEIEKDVSIWGVPLLPSKGAEGTDVVLLKFLRAREFKVNDAFEMLKKTLIWRKESKIDSIVDEVLASDLASAAYMSGVDNEGHPVCYNFFGVFESEELYQKSFGTEEKRSEFLRWRCQLMEKAIQKLNFKPGGVSSLVQINDLKNFPGPKKELRIATNKAVAILQDNYPEMVAKNIFINVPFWYYAINALLSPFLTQRTKSKMVVARPAKVTETLIKYIPIAEIPVQYGGFKRENDSEFSAQDGGAVSELTLKAGSTTTIEIPALEVGSTLCWDLTVLGWEVSYKEEFVPSDEGSYTIIVQKGKKIGSHEGPIRNTFRNNEPGKVILTLDNTSNKKKRVLYRYKINNNKTSF